MSASMIVAQSLSKRYGSTVALDNLNLQLEAGGPIALVGPNGAGKTTLLSLMTQFIKPSSGSIRLFGCSPGTAGLHGKVAALPQDALLDPRLSVGSQLRHYARLQGYGRAEAARQVIGVLEMVRLPQTATMKATALSHGMRKRIAIAQMLLGKPQLALLDEPTAGLDPPNVKVIRELIEQHRHQTTFLVSSHNLDELEKLCERVLVLQQGRLVEQGRIDEIASHDQDDGFLSLRAPAVDPAELQQALAQLPGVAQVEARGGSDYLIHTDPDAGESVDIAIMQLFRSRGWRYKHLAAGRSLEDRLF